MTESGLSKESMSTPALALWLAPLLSAALLYLSFFPVAIGWLAWVAFVPFLALARLPGRPRRHYLAAWVGGAAFYFPALQWFRVAHPAMYLSWISLAVICACYFPVALVVVRFLLRHTPLPLTLVFPVVWVAGEYFRWGIFGSFASILLGTHQHDLPGGFSWYFLGHSQHDFLEVIQIADLTGVYGVSFVVAAVNALLFEVLWARAWFRRLFGAEVAAAPRRTALLLQALVVGVILLGALYYGHAAMAAARFTPGPLVALVQGNLSQGVRNDTSSDDELAREKAVRDVVNHYVKLARAGAKHRPDLIVWPETSYPGHWKEHRPGEPTPRSQQLANDVSRDLRAPSLLGMGADVFDFDGQVRSYNSAILVDRKGRARARYDKVHLVPFGEYVPVRNYLPFLRSLVPYDFDYAVLPGGEFTRFPLDEGPEKWTFGVMICYEDTDPMMARPYVLGDAPVDFLLNISNDGWFEGTTEHEQHLALCRFRAVECRRPIARAVNMGISAVIDGNGRVLRPVQTGTDNGVPIWTVPEGAGSLPLSEWHEYKNVAGVLLARLPLDGRSSLYARYGDWFAAGCLFAVPVLLSLAWVSGRRGVVA